LGGKKGVLPSHPNYGGGACPGCPPESTPMAHIKTYIDRQTQRYTDGQPQRNTNGQTQADGETQKQMTKAKQN